MEIDSKVVGFILYCAREKRDWPQLYDEMCRVAGQGLYQGLRYRDLKRLGFSLGLHQLQQTIELVEAVTDSKVAEASLGFRSYQDSQSPHTRAFVPCADGTYVSSHRPATPVHSG